MTGTGSGTSGWATVATAMIADDAVTAAKLASNAVVTASIVDDNVTQAKIADDAVGADQLASDAVVTASIVDDAVTAAKIHDDAVTKVVVADTTDTSCSVALFESATGSLPPKTDGGLTYNAGADVDGYGVCWPVDWQRDWQRDWHFADCCSGEHYVGRHAY